jgi:hypothetical protein
MHQTLWTTAMCSAEGLGAAAVIGWQEAVARLARERTLAESCAALLKKYGDVHSIDRGSLAYTNAKAEYDGIIAGLSVALASRDKAFSLPGLEASLRRGFEKRGAFCKSVQPLLVMTKQGEKGIVDEIVASGLIGLLLQAGKEIWQRIRDDNALMRKTIGTQLEATVWRPFASIPPLP